MIKYYNKVVILTEEDTYITLQQWQQRYELELGSSLIGKYFSFIEGEFMEDLQDYGTLIVCEPTIRTMDEYRRLKGRPVTVNAFNRSDQKQTALITKGFRAAKISPHVHKMATDMDTLSVEETKEQVPLLRLACENMGFGYRIGWKQYLENKDKEGRPAPQTFLHLDNTPHYFAPNKSRHEEKHPEAWEINKLEW